LALDWPSRQVVTVRHRPDANVASQQHDPEIYLSRTVNSIIDCRESQPPMTRRHSATIYALPAGVRLRARLRFTLHACGEEVRPDSDDDYRQRDRYAIAFGVLMLASLLLTVWYFSGVGPRPGHGTYYAAILAAVWGVFYAWGPLMQLPVLGPLLAMTARLTRTAAVALFFGYIYYQLWAV
jgi:hypothetical protein